MESLAPPNCPRKRGQRKSEKELIFSGPPTSWLESICQTVSNHNWARSSVGRASTCGGMQEPAQVNADGEGKDVEPQRYAAVVVEFQVEVRGRLEIDTGVEAVITDEVGAASGNAGVLIIFAIGGRAAGGAVRGFATTEYAADH